MSCCLIRVWFAGLNRCLRNKTGKNYLSHFIFQKPFRWMISRKYLQVSRQLLIKSRAHTNDKTYSTSCSGSFNIGNGFARTGFLSGFSFSKPDGTFFFISISVVAKLISSSFSIWPAVPISEDRPGTRLQLEFFSFNC